MSRRMFGFLLASMALIALPWPAAKAGHGGGGYGGHGGYGGYHGGFYHHDGFYHGGFYHGGFYPGYHGGFYHPFYRGYGYGYGLGLSLGFYAPYGYGWYGYRPYLPYGVAVPAYPATGAAAAPGDNGAASDQAPERPAPDNRAHLMLVVPANAEVEIAGQKMDAAGQTEREFVSPVLTPGKRYSYKIRIRYQTDGGKPVDETRTVYIRANDWWRVDFTQPAPKPRSEKLPVPKSEP